IFAFWVSALDTVALAGLLMWNGLCMGTVMGVVQVTVQSASGPLRLGQAAASVQFSRSIGAAFGTALVSTVLFAVLSLKNSEAAGIFGAMVENAMSKSGPLPPSPRPDIQADIADAFHAAFLTTAVFTLAGFF